MQQNNHSNKDTCKRVFFLYAKTRHGLKRCVAGDTDENGQVIRETPSKWKGDTKMRHGKLPMNIQFFAEPAGGEPSNDDNPPAAGSNNVEGGQPAVLQIDYEKIKQMLDGTLKAKEDVALKSYFKQQGLSQEEAEQAIASFKSEKAKNSPDVTELQNQVAQGKALVQKAQVEKDAVLMAMSLGLDAKTIPYVLKLADLSSVMDKDGKINEEAVKTAINKVLDDVPQLKPAAAENKGFQIGGGQQNQQKNNVNQNTVPTKRWNRFNN